MSVDIFCEIEGIPGESTDHAHEEWIEIESYSCGVSQPVSGASRTGGRTGGRADFQNFTFSKTLDASSPDLSLFCSDGNHVPKITVECCLATGDKHTFMKYTFEDCIISSVSGGGSSHEIRPMETVTFAFGKVEWEYTPIDQTGAEGSPTTRGWNLEANQAV